MRSKTGKRSLAIFLALMMLSMMSSIVFAAISISSHMTIDSEAASLPGVAIPQGGSGIISLTLTSGSGALGSSSGDLTLPAAYNIDADGSITALGNDQVTYQFDGTNGQAITQNLTVYVDPAAPFGSKEILLYGKTNEPGYHEIGFLISKGSIGRGLHFDIDMLNLFVKVIPPPTYTLTLVADSGEGGIASDLTATNPYIAGTIVNLQAVPNVGYTFSHWTAPVADLQIADANAAITTLTMPAQNVIVTAHFLPVIVETPPPPPSSEEETLPSEVEKQYTVVNSSNPSAPAIASKLLRKNNALLKPNSKEYRNYIAQVTANMGNPDGKGTDFKVGSNYISKDNPVDYEAAINDFLQNLGAY